MKKFLLILPFFLIYICCSGQANFYKFTAGAGFGPTISFADVGEKSWAFAGYGVIDYNITPFVQVGLEFQAGQLKGGDASVNPNKRQFTNQYTAFTLGAKLALGELINYKDKGFWELMKGGYIGLGVGGINNNMTQIVRKGFAGEDKSLNLCVPLNLGMNFFFRDKYNVQRYMLNFNYQGTVTFGEGLDGYDDGRPEGAEDVYVLASVGFRVNFGTQGISRKIYYK